MSDTIAGRFDSNLDAIRAVMEDCGVELGYLFGSSARGAERPDSDLDVAVLLDRRIPSERYGEIQLRLTTELVGLTHTNDVDVVILNAAPPLLVFTAISTGRLFMGNRLRQVRFEVAAIREYIDTRPIRDFIAKRFTEKVRREIPDTSRGAGTW